MNKDRRKAITQLVVDIENIKERLDALKDEEQEYYDNMPESFQNGEKGQAAEAAISNLESAGESLDEAAEYLNESSI